MKKKTIILLWGNAQQVPVIKRANELGYKTVLIDYLEDNPGKEFSDVWYSASTTDIEKVYEITKKEKGNGICAYASDPLSVHGAIMAERSVLPSIPSKSMEILGHKNKFREFLQNNGFHCPKSYSFK